MKLKRKIGLIICIIILFTFFSSIKCNVLAEETKDRMYMSGKVIDDNTVEIDVHLKSSNASGVQGSIMYDSGMILKKIEKNFPEGFSNDVRPKTSSNGEVSEEIQSQAINKGKKRIGFTAASSDAKLNGDTVILKLYFDISNCNAGEYLVEWYTDDIAGTGAATAVFYNGEEKTLETKGYIFKIAEEEEKDDDEEKAKKEAEEKAKKEAEEKAQKEAEEKAKEEAEEKAKKEAEEKAKKEAEEKAKAEAEEKAKKEAEEEAKKQQEASNKAKNNTTNTANNATNTAGKNDEKLPQTGSTSSYIIIGSILMVAVLGVVGFIKAKRTKI